MFVVRRVLSCVVVLLAVACSSTNRLQVEEATSPTSSAGPSSRSAQPKAGAKGAPRASTPTGEGPTASTERAPVATRLPGTAITIPRTGRGWDAKNVYVGVTTNQDIQGFADALGVDSLDSGDQRKDAEGDDRGHQRTRRGLRTQGPRHLSRHQERQQP